MGQFLFGLLAGVAVGLIMEWVIDWTGLLPRKRLRGERVASRQPVTAPANASRPPENDTSALPPTPSYDDISHDDASRE